RPQARPAPRRVGVPDPRAALRTRRLSAAPTRSDPPAPVAAPRAKSAWALPLRIASAMLFVPLLILLVWRGGAAFLTFVTVQVVLGTLEFYGMMRNKGLEPRLWLGLLRAVALQLLAYRP